MDGGISRQVWLGLASYDVDWTVAITSVITLLGVGLGAWLASFFGSRRTAAERRSAYQLQAARHYPTSAASILTNVPVNEVGRFDIDMRMEGVRAFVDAANECRMALAAVAPFCPEVKPYFDAFELQEDQADEVIAILKRCAEAD